MTKQYTGGTIAPASRDESPVPGAPEITMAMVLAGLVALSTWEDRRLAGHDVSEGDLVRSIYAAMMAERLRRPPDA